MTKYRVLVRFAYPTRPDALRMLEGNSRAKLDFHWRHPKWAEVDEIVTDLPAIVIKSALRKGWIEEIGDDKKK